jgi:hypothetical protein
MKVASDQATQPDTIVEQVADVWQTGGGTSEHLLSGMTDRQREAFTADPVFGPLITELRSRETDPPAAAVRQVVIEQAGLEAGQ